MVLRVYHEDQTLDREDNAPSAFEDALKGQKDLESSPGPTNYRTETFLALTKWIAHDLGDNQYKLEGPELKPLQSLFNKVYIRRGQTQVNILGDMTRATLCITEPIHFEKVISRITKEFPRIEEKLDTSKVGVLSFLEQVSNMKKIDIYTTQIIPYRLKINSSQANIKSPRVYNFNFFDLVPEYHLVGNTEIFVAFELQIGLASEIEEPGKNYVAYEGSRILESQILLNSYIKA